MFVYSVKSSKLKIFAFLFLVVVIVVLFLIISGSNESASTKGGVSLKASNAQERVAFLSQFGWEVKEDPIEVAEVIIPSEFDNTYEAYNKLQKEQGFDLSNYKGMRVKRWTYEIKNYPNYAADSGCIRANMLIYNGLVIGGDVCSVELNGFMQGFEMPDSNKKAKPNNKSKKSSATTKKAATTKASTTKAVTTQATTQTTTEITQAATSQAETTTSKTTTTTSNNAA